MGRPRFARPGWAAVLPLLLGGCAFLDVLTFVKDSRSGATGPAQITVEVLGPERPGLTGPLRTRRPQTAVPDVVSAECGGRPRNTSAEAVGPVGTALILAGATLAFDYLRGEIADYVERRQQDFTKSHGGLVNLPVLDLRAAAGAPLCIRYIRELATGEEALQFVAKVIPMGDGFVVRPIYLSVRRPAAETSRSDPAVSITVSLAIAVLQPVAATTSAGAGTPAAHTERARSDRSTTPGVRGEGGLLLPVLLMQRTLAFSGVPIAPVPDSQRRPGSVSDGALGPEFFGDGRDTALFGSVASAASAGTVVVAVTEAGTGAATFAEAGKDIERNAATLRKLMGDVLGQVLSR